MCAAAALTRRRRPAQLSEEAFDAFFCSPLQRAQQTAAVAWGARAPLPGGPVLLPALREVDLYGLQGLVKAEAAAAVPASERRRLAALLEAWREAPARFELDGHAPVRELWHRASLAWQTLLGGGAGGERATLVVAHNAVNQALLGTAAGWTPDAFRRFEQSNGALTVRFLAPFPIRLLPFGTYSSRLV